MKKIMHILVGAMLWLAISPLAAHAFDADGNTEIANASAGVDTIEIEIAPENILPEEQYFIECQATDAKIPTARTAFGNKRTLRVDGLVADITYKCTAALFVEENDVVRYRSKPVSIKTGQSTDFVTVARKDIESDEISFWLNETVLSYEDEYYVECSDGINPMQTARSTDPTGMRVRGLLSDQKYECRVGLIRGEHVHKAGEIFAETTRISPYQLMTITKYEFEDTSATFWLNGPKAEENENYYVNCDEELNRDMVFSEAKSPLGIKVDGLKANTIYSCYSAIVTAADKVRSKGPVVWFTTKPLDTSKTRIVSVTEGSDSAMFKVSGPDLKPGENYYLECEDQEGNTYFNSTGFANDLRLTGLQPETEYSCYGAVTNVATKVISAKGPETTIMTKAAKRDPGKDNAPAADFADSAITDWSQYLNPFPDTDLDQLSGAAAAELKRRNVIGGYEDGEFKGSRDVNRAEAAKFLLLARYGKVDDQSNDGQFPDVEDGVWYTSFVMRAAELGIINGYPDGFFRPANTINRAEFLKMISKTFALEEDLPVTFNDVPADAWFGKYAGAAEKYNLFPGTDSSDPRLYPEKRMSRFDVAIAIQQYLLNR